MGLRLALVSGTALSAAVTGGWSWTATLMTAGPAPLYLGRDLRADYANLAAAPFGSAWGLFAVTAVSYFLSFLASGLRARRKARRVARLEAAAELDLDLEFTEYAEARSGE